MLYDVIVTSVSGKRYNCVFNNVAQRLSERAIVKELCKDPFLELKPINEESTVYLKIESIEAFELIARKN